MKNILIILGIFCLVSLFSAIRFFQMEKATHQRYLRVRTENVELGEEVSLLDRERSQLTGRLEAARGELREVNRKEKELREKYNSLMAKNKELGVQVDMLAQEKEGLNRKVSEMESEGFLARLLKKRVTLEVRVKNLERKLKKTKNLEQELEAVTKVKSALEEQLAEEKEVSEYLSRDFLKEKQEKLIAASRLERIEEEKEGLRILLDRRMGESASLEKELVRLREELKISEGEREKLTAQVVNMERALKERLSEVSLVRSKLEGAIKELEPEEKTVELPPIVVKVEAPSTRVQPQKTTPGRITQRGELRGKIVTVNEEHNFVVIDLGSDDGLETGMLFGVYRNKKGIAKVKVVGIRDQISAADIISLASRTKIKPGDTIKSK